MQARGSYCGSGFRAVRSGYIRRGHGSLLAFTSLLVVQLALAQDNPVKTIADRLLSVSGAHGSGQLALFSEADLSTPQSAVTRVIVVFHGLQRNAAEYLHDVEEARGAAGIVAEKTLLIAPQFLDEDDVRAHKVAAEVLRWRRNGWEAGEPATRPAPISSYEAIDAILARLSDRGLFPNLREIVLAGHSGGGQIVQRYAIVGRQIAAVEKTGITLRYVVANPSSYVYFDEYRPVSGAAFNCLGFNTWKYGLRNGPSYLSSPLSSAALETAYITRRVTYLFGAEDNDPNGPEIDKTCAAEVQGATRLQRGANYFKYLQSRHETGLEHRVLLVFGVGHNARAIFNSACGIYSLFEAGACRPVIFK